MDHRIDDILQKSLGVLFFAHRLEEICLQLLLLRFLIDRGELEVLEGLIRN